VTDIRTPPSDQVAERSLLGAMLLAADSAALLDTVDRVDVDDFYFPANGAVFSSIRRLHLSQRPVDAVTVMNDMSEQQTLDRIGGAPYLHTLVEQVPHVGNAQQYAEIVAGKASLRRLIVEAERITAQAYNGDGTVGDIVDRAEAGILAAASSRTTDGPRSAADAFPAMVEHLETLSRRDGALVGAPTGITELDICTSGFTGGQFVIVAARPGVGKSTLALNIARHSALQHQIPVGFFSLEMSETEVMTRLCAAEAQVGMTSLKSGQITERQWHAISGVHDRIADAPLYIDASETLTSLDLRARARRLVRSHGVKVIIVDYLQLISSHQRSESRQQEVSDLARALKLLAKELDVALIALSQLNRAVETRVDRKPHMADLRESGSLEQDSDIVLLLHREDLHDPSSQRAGEADIIVAKHRAGPTKTVPTIFQGHFARLLSMPPSS
jgi:replicative DNA helicase